MKRLLKQADEYDVFSKWRKVLHWRPGEVAAIKRRVRRRERHEAKKELEIDMDR